MRSAGATQACGRAESLRFGRVPTRRLPPGAAPLHSRQLRLMRVWLVLGAAGVLTSTAVSRQVVGATRKQLPLRRVCSVGQPLQTTDQEDRKSTRLNSSH